MVGRELALAMDTEHAALRENDWEQLTAFGMKLESLLISEGYAAELVSTRELPPCTCQVLLEVESIASYIQVWYYNGNPPRYSVSGSSDVDFGRWVSNIVGIESLLVAIPALISELIEGSCRVRARRECSRCYYGTEYYPPSSWEIGEDRHYGSDGYCGMGLVGNGNCSHYVGPAPEEVQE
jgi:hypothetical protein